jgi:hypothetical protein
MSYPKLSQSEINVLSKFTYRPVTVQQQPEPIVEAPKQQSPVIEATHPALLEMAEQCDVAS